MKLLPFQREFIKAVENPKYDTVAISGPRTLGKTFIAAQVLIRCLTPGDSLHQPGKEYILGAATLEQARLTYSFIRKANPLIGLDAHTRKVILEERDAATLQGRVVDATMPTAQVYTDEALAYAGLPRHHEAAQHKTGEYVREQAHTNGIESFWAMLDRGIMGNFHHVSHKHLDRYIGEFAGRHNQRSQDTLHLLHRVAGGMVGKRLRYKELIG